MRKRLIKIGAGLTFGFFFISCSSKKTTEKVPGEFIQPDNMVVLLADIHIAEAQTFVSGNPDSAAKAKLASHYKFVFDKHHTNAASFKQSFEYYRANTALFNDVYNKVIDELSKRQAEIEK